MTASKLTLEQMYELIERHGRGEMERDWQGVFDTMTDAPYYEFFPYRLRISSQVAIESGRASSRRRGRCVRSTPPHVPGAH
jgi:hypothetical protein